MCTVFSQCYLEIKDMWNAMQCSQKSTEVSEGRTTSILREAKKKKEGRKFLSMLGYLYHIAYRHNFTLKTARTSNLTQVLNLWLVTATVQA